MNNSLGLSITCNLFIMDHAIFCFMDAVILCNQNSIE